MEDNNPPAPPSPPGKDTPTLTLSGSSGGAEAAAQTLQVANRERYQVHGIVAEGGQGRIFRAKDLQLERIVALKELRTPGGELETRFVREARITARLQHPAIVPVYEAGRWPSGEPFYAMKLVAGRSLARFIDSLQTLAERLAALPHVLTVAEAIAYAHGQRIIHRDLKPSNVVVGEFGETVVVDWGLCKDLDRTEPHQTEPNADSSALLGSEYTQIGTVMGTPAYLPPEQALGKAVDERADVYALGAMLYQLLSGKPPYQGKTGQDVLQKMLKEEPAPLNRLQPGVPEELLTIVSRAMKREPDHRYPSAREFAEDLKHFMSGQLVGSHQYTVWQRMRRFSRQYRAPLRVAAVALAALVAGAVFDYQRVRHERDRAEEKQRVAEEAERKATQRADELTIIEAHNALARSPEQVFKLLDSLSPAFAQWGQARTLAADAVSLGLGTLLKGHTRGLRSIQFSPDGHWLLSTNEDRTARLWDLQDGTSRVVATHDSEALLGIFSPDGAYVATSSKYGPIKLWQSATGTSRDLIGHTLMVTSLAFLPDSHSLISAGADGQIRCWDVASGTGRLVGTHSGGIDQLDLLRDGVHAVSWGRESKTARLWNLRQGSSQQLGDGVHAVTAASVASQKGSWVIGTRQGKILLWDSPESQPRTLSSGLDSLYSLTLSPDGRRLVVGGGGGSGSDLRLWNLESGTSWSLSNTRRWDLQISPRVVFSPNSQWLLIGGRENGEARTVLLDLTTAESRLVSKTGYLSSQGAVSPDGAELAFMDGVNVRLYRVKGDEPFASVFARYEEAFATEDSIPGGMPGNVAPKGRFKLRGAVTALAWASSGHFVLSAGKISNRVRLTNMKGEYLVDESTHEGRTTAAFVLPDGSELATAGSDGTVGLWNESGQLIKRLPSPSRRIDVLTLSHGGEWVAGGDASGEIWLWEVSSGRNRALGRHGRPVRTLSFSPDGRYLASGGGDGELRLCEIASGVGRTIHQHRGELSVVGFSPGGHFLAAGGVDGTWLQPLEDDEAGQLLDSGTTSALLFSADGEHLFTAGEMTIPMWWDVKARKLKKRLRSGNDFVADIALSPEGQRLAAAGMHGLIHLWDLQSGESRVLSGHDGNATHVAFSPDGRYLVSTGTDGTVRLWKDDLPLKPEEFRAWVHQAAQQ